MAQLADLQNKITAFIIYGTLSSPEKPRNSQILARAAKPVTSPVTTDGWGTARITNQNLRKINK